MPINQDGDSRVITTHEFSAVVTRACTKCRHAAAAHVDGQCQGWPSKNGTGPTIVNNDGQELHTEPCECAGWDGVVEDLGVLGRY